MRTIQRTVKTSSIRAIAEMVYLDLIVTDPSLIPQPPKTPRPENMIEPLPKTDTEKITREYAKATVDEFKRLGMPTSLPQAEMLTRLPKQPSFSIEYRTCLDPKLEATV